MFQDNGLSPGLSYLNERSLLYSPKIEKTGNLVNFLTDFHKENIGIPTKYINISLTVRLQVVVAKQEEEQNDRINAESNAEGIFIFSSNIILRNYFQLLCPKYFKGICPD